MKNEIEQIIISVEKVIDDCFSSDAIECLKSAIDNIQDALDYEPETCDHQHNVAGDEVNP